MSHRYRQTRPVFLLMSGWFLLGIILLAHTLACAGAEVRPPSAFEQCTHANVATGDGVAH